MSRLEELIAELCPNGVKYKTLGEIGTFIRGNGLQKKDFTESGVGCIHYGQIYTYYGNFIYKTKSFVTKNLAKNLKKVSTGDLIFAITSENIEDICKCVAWLGEDDIVTGGHSAIFKHSQNSKFITYYTQTENFFNQKRKIISGTKVIEVSPAKLSLIKIPVPPLPIQEEIVRILDTFTELTTELTKRKEQYQYYRDLLLTFDRTETRRTSVKWLNLGDVALIFERGRSRHRPRNDSRLYGGSTPFIQTGDIKNAAHVIREYQQTYSKFGLEQSKLWPKGTLCITIAANIAETSILGFDACFPDSVIGFIPDPKKTTSEYVEYLLSTYKRKLQSKSTGSAQDNLNIAAFENTLLPFPTLEEQANIVAILDRFDALCNDLTSGLPAEIEARQKQYE